MTSKSFRRLVLFLVLTTGGCVVGDELQTFTLNADGSADLVVFRSNLHSTEKGEKAEKELAEYRASFEKQSNGEFGRIREADGEIVLTSWVRAQPPFSNLVRVHFPDMQSLEKYWTVKNEHDQPLVTTHFKKAGQRQRVTFQVSVPDDKDQPARPTESAQQLRQALADGISETRFAITEGAIVSARGFTVAGDRQSALLNTVEVSELIRAGKGEAELWLEWE